MPMMNPPRPPQFPQTPPRPVESRNILPVIWTAVQIFTAIAICVLLYKNHADIPAGNSCERIPTSPITVLIFGELWGSNPGGHVRGLDVICTDFSRVISSRIMDNRIINTPSIQDPSLIVFGCQHFELVYEIYANLTKSKYGTQAYRIAGELRRNVPDVTYIVVDGKK